MREAFPVTRFACAACTRPDLHGHRALVLHASALVDRGCRSVWNDVRSQIESASLLVELCLVEHNFVRKIREDRSFFRRADLILPHGFGLGRIWSHYSKWGTSNISLATYKKGRARGWSCEGYMHMQYSGWKITENWTPFFDRDQPTCQKKDQ